LESLTFFKQIQKPLPFSLSAITPIFTSLFTLQFSGLLMIGILRAYKKLVHVLFMTFTATTALVIKQFFRPSEKRQLSNEYRLLWAQRCIKILGIKIHIEGTPPPDGFVLVSNHRSYIDPPVIMATNNCTMLSKSEVTKMPILGAGAKAVDILFVERQKRSSRVESIEVIANALNRNVSVCIFPEGTTNHLPELLTFKPGIFNLAAKRNCPVIPVALTYLDPQDVWKKESMHTHYIRCFSKPVVEVKLKFGPAFKNANPRELRQTCFNWIQENLRETEPVEKSSFQQVKA